MRLRQDPGLPAGIPRRTTLDSFFPGKVTIAAGDTITFSSATFHSVAYGLKPPAFFLPDPAKGKYARLDDAAGDPFYFVGMAKVIYNGQAFGPFGPKTISGRGDVERRRSRRRATARRRSRRRSRTRSRRRARTSCFCTIHPGMKATVMVKPAGSAVPLTPTQVQAAALQGVNAGVGEGEGAGRRREAAREDRLHGRRQRRDDPRLLPEQADGEGRHDGDVREQVAEGAAQRHLRPEEVHPAAAEDDRPVPDGPGRRTRWRRSCSYGSEPKGGYRYDGTNHGNGFFATPVTIGSPARAAAALVDGHVHEARASTSTSAGSTVPT